MQEIHKTKDTLVILVEPAYADLTGPEQRSKNNVRYDIFRIPAADRGGFVDELCISALESKERYDGVKVEGLLTQLYGSGRQLVLDNLLSRLRDVLKEDGLLQTDLPENSSKGFFYAARSAGYSVEKRFVIKGRDHCVLRKTKDTAAVPGSNDGLDEEDRYGPGNSTHQDTSSKAAPGDDNHRFDRLKTLLAELKQESSKTDNA
ncbi:hypothetical protein GF351_04560 [Candidatus Woesearchaeota archaeon]|nr:hypothetical protein [Candidatus Woesearchaeota archaeon]